MAAGASTHWLAWPQALVHVISYRMRRVSLWLPPLLYMVLIFQFSSESSPMPEVTEHVWDKLLHLAEYAGLAVLFCRALTGEGLGWLAAALTALLLASGYGATDEWHQAFVPLRSTDLNDWLADTFGATIGAALYAVRPKGRLKPETTTEPDNQLRTRTVGAARRKR